jgi:hypothetical protein
MGESGACVECYGDGFAQETCACVSLSHREESRLLSGFFRTAMPTLIINTAQLVRLEMTPRTGLRPGLELRDSMTTRTSQQVDLKPAKPMARRKCSPC